MSTTSTSPQIPPRTGASDIVADGDNRVRQERGDARRQQILDAAVELFAEKGYEATGVATLAERVGMTAPGLLYYFGTKERLLREVVDERGRSEQVDLDAIGGPRRFMLRELGRYNMAHATLTRLYVRLGAESLDPDAPLHDFFRTRYVDARARFRRALEVEQERGHIRADADVDRIGTEMLATLMGLEIQWLMDPDGVDLGEAGAAYVDRVFAELASDGERCVVGDEGLEPPTPAL